MVGLISYEFPLEDDALFLAVELFTFVIQRDCKLFHLHVQALTRIGHRKFLLLLVNRLELLSDLVLLCLEEILVIELGARLLIFIGGPELMDIAICLLGHDCLKGFIGLLLYFVDDIVLAFHVAKEVHRGADSFLLLFSFCLCSSQGLQVVLVFLFCIVSGP